MNGSTSEAHNSVDITGNGTLTVRFHLTPSLRAVARWVGWIIKVLAFLICAAEAAARGLAGHQAQAAAERLIEAIAPPASASSARPPQVRGPAKPQHHTGRDGSSGTHHERCGCVTTK
jgi:hypothetical protein